MKDNDDTGSNPTDNPHILDVISARLSRRSVLGSSLAAAAVSFLGCSSEEPNAAQAELELKRRGPKGKSRLRFEEVPPSLLDEVVVPPGYVAEVLIPWGTPLFRSSASFKEDASNSAAEQAGQVGFNHDGMHYFPLSNGHRGSERGLLVVNHEYTDANQIYSAAQGSAITADAAGLEKVAKALAGHGVSVVEIEQKRNGSFTHVVRSRYNRRITGTTPMDFSGPVSASHPALASSITPRPLGTLNNCGNGFTPWGTYLTCEENWNGYFGAADTSFTPSAAEARYGVSRTSSYNWHVASERFDLAKNRNELNHFGWVVEIDPFDPESTPVKRTALGRIKHEGAAVTERQGRLVVYTGDDENGEYLYKFEGSEPWRKLRARGRSPLDHGTLYVAKFAEDGTGQWLPLVHGRGPLTVENGWSDQADVLLRTRQAADAVGATRLHRPEWVAVNEKSGDVFVTLTNGSGNDHPVNSSRANNPYGHIIRFSESSRRSEQSFEWAVFVIAGDPAYDVTVPAEQAVFGSPDGLFVDPDGLVWIETDISNSSQNLASRGYDHVGNNQLLVADPETGAIKRFLTGPRGCEITGITMTPDQRSLFVNVQHPGESTTYWNELNGGAPSVTNPSVVSSWPFGGRPRPATVVVRKLDGGKIGT